MFKQMMKKKVKRIAVILAAGLSTLAFAGCGAAPVVQPAAKPEIEVETETETEAAARPEAPETSGEQTPESAEAPDGASAESAPAETPSADGPSADAGEDPEELRKLFQSFLEDKASLTISTLKSEYLTFDQSYTFSAMREALNAALRENWGGDQAPQLVSASWAEIDCGNDGIPEFALSLEMDTAERTNTMTDYYIIKAFNGNLLAVEWEEDYYRSYAELNKYGVISSGGSGGAAIHYSGYRMVDAEGMPQFIYQLELDSAIKEPIISRYSLPESAVPDSYPEEEFAEEGIERDIYSFAEAPEYGTPEYDDYLLSMSYVFLDGEKTVYPEKEMMALYDSLGITITDTAHVQEMIDRRIAELGLTKEQLASPSENADNAPPWVMFYEEAG